MTGDDDLKNTVDAALNNADELISQNKNDEAIKVLKEAIKGYYPQHNDCLEVTRIFDVLGRLYADAGDLKEGQHYFCRSLITKMNDLGVVSRELALAYRNVASCETDERMRGIHLEHAKAMELPEEEFQLLKQSLLTDEDLEVVKTLVKDDGEL